MFVLDVPSNEVDEVATELRAHNVDDENGGFGLHDGGGDVPRTDVFTSNAFANSQNPKVAVEAKVCNVPDVSITSTGRIGVLESVYVACNIVKEALNHCLTVDVPTGDQLVHDSIVAGPSMKTDPPTRRARSLRVKKASTNTKMLFTRSGRKRDKRDV